MHHLSERLAAAERANKRLLSENSTLATSLRKDKEALFEATGENDRLRVENRRLVAEAQQQQARNAGADRDRSARDRDREDEQGRAFATVADLQAESTQLRALVAELRKRVEMADERFV